MNAPMPPQVRTATPADFRYIIASAEELHAENGHASIDRSVAEPALMEAINRNKSIIGLIGPVGDIQGIIYLRFCNFWYTAEIYLEELFTYVPPAYRQGTGNARALLDFAKSTADRLGVKLIIGVLSSERTKAKLKLYERHFGEPAGGYFFLHPKG